MRIRKFITCAPPAGRDISEVRSHHNRLVLLNLFERRGDLFPEVYDHTSALFVIDLFRQGRSPTAKKVWNEAGCSMGAPEAVAADSVADSMAEISAPRDEMVVRQKCSQCMRKSVVIGGVCPACPAKQPSTSGPRGADNSTMLIVEPESKKQQSPAVTSQTPASATAPSEPPSIQPPASGVLVAGQSAPNFSDCMEDRNKMKTMFLLYSLYMRNGEGPHFCRLISGLDKVCAPSDNGHILQNLYWDERGKGDKKTTWGKMYLTKHDLTYSKEKGAAWSEDKIRSRHSSFFTEKANAMIDKIESQPELLAELQKLYGECVAGFTDKELHNMKRRRVGCSQNASKRVKTSKPEECADGNKL